MSTTAPVNPPKKYDFDDGFQSKIVACMLKSPDFLKLTDGAVKPQYFLNASEAYLIDLVTRFYAKYHTQISGTSLMQLLNQRLSKGTLRKVQYDEIVEAYEAVKQLDIADYEFIADEINKFARHRALEDAILKSVELLDSGEYEEVEKLISQASRVGVKSEISNYDFFGQEEINFRETLRKQRLAGSQALTGNIITTGIAGLDNVLYHKGWAKKEMYCLMGAPKSGKSISLAFFAKNASISGRNVLFVTLEVATDVTAERIDSCLTGLAMSELADKSQEAKEAINDLVANNVFGKLIIEEFPAGTLTPNGLLRVIEKHKNLGNYFDMVVVDYADIMRPNVVSKDNPIENSKSIYVDLRGIAQSEDVVLITAMQTNRQGSTASVAKMEHAAEDFNKIRIPDLVISINSTEDEKTNGLARLFFAASRNQVGNITISIEQDLSTMTFIKKILSIT